MKNCKTNFSETYTTQNIKYYINLVQNIQIKNLQALISISLHSQRKTWWTDILSFSNFLHQLLLSNIRIKYKKTCKCLCSTLKHTETQTKLSLSHKTCFWQSKGGVFKLFSTWNLFPNYIKYIQMQLSV